MIIVNHSAICDGKGNGTISIKSSWKCTFIKNWLLWQPDTWEITSYLRCWYSKTYNHSLYDLIWTLEARISLFTFWGFQHKNCLVAMVTNQNVCVKDTYFFHTHPFMKPTFVGFRKYRLCLLLPRVGVSPFSRSLWGPHRNYTNCDPTKWNVAGICHTRSFLSHDIWYFWPGNGKQLMK